MAQAVDAFRVGTGSLQAVRQACATARACGVEISNEARALLQAGHTQEPASSEGGGEDPQMLQRMVAMQNKAEHERHKHACKQWPCTGAALAVLLCSALAATSQQDQLQGPAPALHPALNQVRMGCSALLCLWCSGASSFALPLACGALWLLSMLPAPQYTVHADCACLLVLLPLPQLMSSSWALASVWLAVAAAHLYEAIAFGELALCSGLLLLLLLYLFHDLPLGALHRIALAVLLGPLCASKGLLLCSPLGAVAGAVLLMLWLRRPVTGALRGLFHNKEAHAVVDFTYATVCALGGSAVLLAAQWCLFGLPPTVQHPAQALQHTQQALTAALHCAVPVWLWALLTLSGCVGMLLALAWLCDITHASQHLSCSHVLLAACAAAACCTAPFTERSHSIAPVLLCVLLCSLGNPSLYAAPKTLLIHLAPTLGSRLIRRWVLLTRARWFQPVVYTSIALATLCEGWLIKLDQARL
eukprot:TRINITY_DN9804_c0_g1_i1.p1 TRINITY_DN9804_c0_g1~~TRINITY_DN9804_c0_g1_i1.p1  ORF type:complete len:474 (-),score=140.53 TRINITY_DN9804_c0_g1_i1:211-1632(-)